MTVLLRSTCVPKKLEKRGSYGPHGSLFDASQGWHTPLEFSINVSLASACAHGSAPICAGNGRFNGAALIEDDEED